MPTRNGDEIMTINEDAHIEMYQHSLFTWWVSYVKNNRRRDVEMNLYEHEAKQNALERKLITGQEIRVTRNRAYPMSASE